jgi:sirohydrochlorin cobaltochelatase
MKLAGDGIDKVIVSPVFIAKGVHTNSDITEIIERVRNETGMKIGYADPLGADPRIVDILLDRARDAESRIE